MMTLGMKEEVERKRSELISETCKVADGSAAPCQGGECVKKWM